MNYRSYSDLFNPHDFVEQFLDVLKLIKYTSRNPLNTEMFFLWCMIQTFKPDLFIESGTFRGYSANFICEGLKQTGKKVRFVSYGYNLEECIPYAIERLSQYDFAKVIEGNSIQKIRFFTGEKRETAFFIDGPKGKNLPSLLFQILECFEDITFIAVHDCERESGSNNRWYVEHFKRFGFSILFCGTDFQEEFSFLDKPLLGNEEMNNWRPHIKNNKPISSYGTETGYLIPDSGIHSGKRKQMLVYWLIFWFYFHPRVIRRFRKRARISQELNARNEQCTR